MVNAIRNLGGVILLGLVSTVSGQEMQEEIADGQGRVGIVELREIQQNSGALVTDTVRKFRVSAKPGVTWIPLGLFRYSGAPHRIEIGADGHSAHSTAICEFSVSWAGFVWVHSIKQANISNRFVLYSYRHNNERGVVLKYINVNGGKDNGVNVTYRCAESRKWIPAVAPDVDSKIEQISANPDAYRMTAGIEQHLGPQDYLSDGLVRGLYFNTRSTFSGNSLFRHNVTVDGRLNINGELVLSEPAGDISMGIFGN